MTFNTYGARTLTPTIYRLDSPEGLRQIIAALFLGYNYRLYTEGQTRSELLDAYEQLVAIRQRLPEDSGDDEWVAALQNELERSETNLAWWVLGLTNKTAQNLGVTRSERLNYLKELVVHIREVTDGRDGLDFDDAMLMIWAGSATLTVRGSRKSSVGKTLERAFVRAGLSILGLVEDEDFWLNLQRDVEVSREIDAEIASRRGRIRVELGLIERGNQEVIEDKVNRVGAGGIVIFDRLGPKSNAWQTALNQQVQFIQIRNNRPLTELYNYLNDRVDKTLIEPPENADGIKEAIDALPDSLFTS